MNFYFYFIISILVLTYFLNLVIESLNLRNIKDTLPQEFIGYYDEEKYEKSQNYLKENTVFSLIHETINLVVLICVIVLGWLNPLDIFVRNFGYKPLVTGLLFLGLFFLISTLSNLPFSIYKTFVIEEKYGFNKTTIKTFILDIIKSLLLTAILGGIVLAVLLWFFENIAYAWAYAWLFISIFQIVLTFLAPVVIMPIFNKFTPLEEGELNTAIMDYAKNIKFGLKGVFKMDGSKRSAKSNAFFTGFGRFRRIVLFDTLIAKHTTVELVSVLAHEMGHYKKRHILKMITFSILTTGAMLFILSLFINNTGLFFAFKISNLSIYASLVLFGFLYSPLGMALSIVANFFSRGYEFEADRYAVSTYKNPTAFINALKKLSVDNLSNLTPHPLKVFFEYSHPPVLSRIKAISNENNKQF